MSTLFFPAIENSIKKFYIFTCFSAMHSHNMSTGTGLQYYSPNKIVQALCPSFKAWNSVKLFARVAKHTFCVWNENNLLTKWLWRVEEHTRKRIDDTVVDALRWERDGEQSKKHEIRGNIFWLFCFYIFSWMFLSQRNIWVEFIKRTPVPTHQ